MKNKRLLRYFGLMLLIVPFLKSCKNDKKKEKEPEKEIVFEGDAFKVSGQVDDLDTEEIYISYKDAEGSTLNDTIKVEDESFEYSNKIEDFTAIVIWPNVDRVLKKTRQGYYPAKSSQFQFIAYPGADVKFSGEITDYIAAYPSGDIANDDLGSLNKKIFPLLNESVNLMVEIANEKITDSTEIQEAQERIEDLGKESVDVKKEFIKNNPDSYVSALTLEDMMVRSEVKDDEAVALFDDLDSETIEDASFYKDASERVDGIRATAPGSPAPKINSKNTYDGERFDLASLEGKYVVLDFWGTWCGPCIQGMPRMKEYLDKYEDDMEIVGIAQESDDGTRWKEFIDENQEYNWHHVLSRKDEDYILKYNVAGFPTKIIIDPEGKIVERFVGEDDSIYDKLDEVFEQS